MPVTFYLHNPIRFCIRILLDAKIGLGESYMLADWDASPSAKDFLTLLIRAKRETFDFRSFTFVIMHLTALDYLLFSKHILPSATSNKHILLLA